MNQPRKSVPACLACNFSDLCDSCAQQQRESMLGRVGRLQFVVVKHKRIHSNFHRGIKRDMTVLRELPVCTTASEDLEFLVVDEQTLRHDIELLGFDTPELVACTDRSFVYKATRRGLKGFMCIKVYRPEILKSRFGHKTFSSHAQVAVNIDSGCFPAVYEYGFASYGAPYIVSQFVDGPTLNQLAEENIEIDPINLFAQLCEALGYLHDRGYVHGRLTSSKIICVPLAKNFFVVKVLDSVVTSSLLWQQPFKLDLLRASVSPEERFGQDPDLRSDIYSLGYVMYEVVTGVAPQFNRSRELIGFSNLCGASRLLEPLIMRCLADEPNERYGSTYDILQELNGIEL